jgi:pimeloyl-ACP methyl ester carboxylesterase
VVGVQPAVHDAIVVVPGIMGSALYDTEAERLIWGADNLRWYWEAWTRRDGLRRLALDDDERAGRYSRVVPTTFLRAPAWAPFLGGFDPYTRLLHGVYAMVAAPQAVLEFAYDWRLPVEHNAARLAEAMARHLEAWQREDAHLAARRLHPDGRPAQIVVVAHSMGGLLAQALTLIPGATADIRTTITIGTPFYGSVRTALIMNVGRGLPVPLPARRLREVARTMPGLHDLLPTYRCVHTPDGPAMLEPADVRSIGGDFDLADRSRAFYERLDQRPLVGHHSVVGIAQKTPQGLVLRDGVITATREAFRYVRGGILAKEEQAGDGTVHWESAALVEKPTTVAQQHGTLASTGAVVSLVGELFRRPGGRPRPLLGAGDLGIGVPDTVEAKTAIPVEVSRSGANVTCYELTGRSPRKIVDRVKPRWEDGVPTARLTLPRPGLYRIEADGSGGAAVHQVVLATDPNDSATE